MEEYRIVIALKVDTQQYTIYTMFQKQNTLPIVHALCLFVALRPLVSIGFLTTHTIAGLRYTEIFSSGMSYMLLVAFLLSRPRMRFGYVETLIFAFLAYVALSIVWGSHLRDIARLMLPPIVFFSVRSAVQQKKMLNALFVLSITVSFLPVALSSLLILSGRSVGIVKYWTGLVRYQGVYGGTHTLAHQMFIILSLLFIYFSINGGLNNRGLKRNGIGTYFCYLVVCCSLFNIYKSFTRTVYIGVATLIGLHLIGRRCYGLLIIAFSVLVVLFVTSSQMQTIFFDVIEPLQGKQDMANIGSGRIGIWTDAISQFRGLPFERCLLGIGLGNETLYSHSFFGASHNDLIALLLSIGIIGLLLYLWIIGIFAFDILRSDIPRVTKYTYLGFLCAVSAMNFASNSYISRVPMAQYFFFIMGTFYAFRDLSMKRSDDNSRSNALPIEVN